MVRFVGGSVAPTGTVCTFRFFGWGHTSLPQFRWWIRCRFLNRYFSAFINPVLLSAWNHGYGTIFPSIVELLLVHVAAAKTLGLLKPVLK